MARVVPASHPELEVLLADVLGAGGVAIMPCDTIYGIVGVVPETEARIRLAKGRGETKPFVVLVPETAWVARLAAVAPPERLAALWPGPITLILPAAGGATVALRVPQDGLLRRLMRRIGRPLYSTSVNRSGEPALTDAAAIEAGFADRVDLIVDAGDRSGGVPSTIVDLAASPPRVVRQGALVVPPELLG